MTPEQQICPYCGAEKVLNPHTNKWFCKEKCWLRPKGTTTSGQYKPQGTNFQRVEPKDTLIMDEIEKIKTEIKELRRYLQGKLGE